MSEKSRIFVSSVQKELAAERRAVRDFVEGDALLRRFFDIFLFEDLPASGWRPDELYLSEVESSAVYIGIFGSEYGYEDAAGISPTEREFDHATAKGKERLIFVKGSDDKTRHPKMRALIGKASDQLNRRRFRSIPELTALVYASLVEYLVANGAVQTKPFDAAACPDAALTDLSRGKIVEFLARAQAERGYPLGPRTPMNKALAHLNLLDGGRPSTRRFFCSESSRSVFSLLPKSSVCISMEPKSASLSLPIKSIREASSNSWIRPWTLSWARSTAPSAPGP